MLLMGISTFFCSSSVHFFSVIKYEGSEHHEITKVEEEKKRRKRRTHEERRKTDRLMMLLFLCRTLYLVTWRNVYRHERISSKWRERKKRQRKKINWDYLGLQCAQKKYRHCLCATNAIDKRICIYTCIWMFKSRSWLRRNATRYQFLCIIVFINLTLNITLLSVFIKLWSSKKNEQILRLREKMREFYFVFFADKISANSGFY